MNSVRKQIRGTKEFFGTDWSILRAKRLARRGARAAPRGIANYLLNKVPIVQWIPAYNMRWLPSDILSGVCVGIVLALQAVNLQFPLPAGAGISIQQCLLASWVPGFIYTVTGTSKNISVGPTSTTVLLALPAVVDVIKAKLKEEHVYMPAAQILPALTLAVSSWFFIFGMLGLGFFFDLMPTYFALALVLGLSIISITMQLPALLGILGIQNQFLDVIPGVLDAISTTNGKAVAISLASIVFLGVISFLKSKWGKEKTTRGRITRYSASAGILLLVVILTGISSIYLQTVPIDQQVAPFVMPPMPADKSEGSSGAAARGLMSIRQEASAGAAGGAAGGLAALAPSPPPKPLPLWSGFPEFHTPFPAENIPIIMSLAQHFFMPSLTIFLFMNIEHLLVARFYGYDLGYSTSDSQEMFSLGVINAVNAVFGGVPVGGGDVARSAVLAFTGSKSPLNQLFTSITVLICMMPLSSALRYFPQAALSSIIVVAVVERMPPQKIFGYFFKTSFADFVAFFLVMNVVVVAPTGIDTTGGTGLGIFYLMFYTMFRIMFKRPKVVSTYDMEMLFNPKSQDVWMEGDTIPATTLVIKTEGDLMFSNGERLRRKIMDAAYLNHSGKVIKARSDPDRAWNVIIDRYVSSIRRRKGSPDLDADLVFRPRLRMVIFDMTATPFIDTSAVMSFELLKKQLRGFAGDLVEFRYVGLNKHLQRRFRRAKWQIIDPYGPRMEVEGEDDALRELMFDSLPQAMRFVSQDLAVNGTFDEIAKMEYPKDISYPMQVSHPV